MRIVEEYSETYEKQIKVVSANYIGDYAIRIKFSDDSEKLVDFKYFIVNSIHQTVKKYVDEDLFKKFNIADGNINWKDYDLIFPVWDLYTGNI
ncbi:MAG: DUF2442 domain-containing protein [Bacteroidales bacterium]|nr:DUF2442 domain-containing protein [Bacteroidales bacterium]